MKLTRDDPADGGACPTHARDDDEAESFVFEARHADVVRIALPITLCKEEVSLSRTQAKSTQQTRHGRVGPDTDLFL